MNRFIFLIPLLLVLSCTSEKTSGVDGQKAIDRGAGSISETSQTIVSATGGSFSLEITPINITRNGTVYLTARGFKPSDARIEWLVNDKIMSSPAVSQLNTAEIKKGDKVQAKATIQGEEIPSNTIQIKNSPPVISKVKILPEVFKPGDTCEC